MCDVAQGNYIPVTLYRVVSVGIFNSTEGILSVAGTSINYIQLTKLDSSETKKILYIIYIQSQDYT